MEQSCRTLHAPKTRTIFPGILAKFPPDKRALFVEHVCDLLIRDRFGPGFWAEYSIYDEPFDIDPRPRESVELAGDNPRSAWPAAPSKLRSLPATGNSRKGDRGRRSPSISARGSPTENSCSLIFENFGTHHSGIAMTVRTAGLTPLLLEAET